MSKYYQGSIMHQRNQPSQITLIKQKKQRTNVNKPNKYTIGMPYSDQLLKYFPTLKEAENKLKEAVYIILLIN